MFDASDLQHSSSLHLRTTTASEVSGNRDLPGRTVSIGGILPRKVIGILQPKGLSTSGEDLDNCALFPSTFRAYFGLVAGYSEIQVRPHSPDLLEASRLESMEIIRRSHALGPEDPDDFRISSPLQAVQAAEQVSLILTRLLAAIAAVSLLVGGIGIMNIQLVSVAERTGEIGIRAAIGASPGQLMMHFLYEAAALSVLGTSVGIAIGLSVS
ncbi:MAG: FtsX-like permease family protein [Myxococcota bacterium]